MPETAAMARFTSGPAIAMRMSRAGSESPLPHVFHQGDAADGQQQDGAHHDAVMFGDYGVSQFVQHDAAENYGDQRQAANGTGLAHGGRLRDPHKHQQSDEGEMDAKIHSQNPSRGKRPASHQACGVPPPSILYTLGHAHHRRAISQPSVAIAARPRSASHQRSPARNSVQRAERSACARRLNLA